MKAPLLNFEGGPGVPLLNFKGVPVPSPKVLGSRGPGPTLTPCQYFADLNKCLSTDFPENLLERKKIHRYRNIEL